MYNILFMTISHTCKQWCTAPFDFHVLKIEATSTQLVAACPLQMTREVSYSCGPSFLLGYPISGCSEGFYWGGRGQEQGLQCMMCVICHGKQMRFWCPCDPGVWGSHGSMGLSLFWTHSSCRDCVGGKSGGNLCTGMCEFQSNSICLLLLPLSSLSSAEQHEMWVLWLPVENSVMWSFCGYIVLNCLPGSG